MRRWVYPLFIFFLFIGGLETSRGISGVAELRIWSPAYENNGNISEKYTCDGPNTNPPLKIDNIPPQSRSLVLIFDDIDAPRGSYVHWILWNIDPTIKEIRENSVPEGAVQGMNDFKRQDYGGPCPPGRAHRYVFKIYALDSLLDINPNSSKKDLEKAIEKHRIAQAQWMGVYKRRNPPKK
jgi:Raf kinase inhibitor-like YbhB/YbcL family protein